MSNPYETPNSPGSGMSGAGMHGAKPNNNLILAVVATVCCGCLPLGIVSIVYAAQVDSKWKSGDHGGAIEAADNAKKWAFISIGVGVVLTVISLVLQGLFAAQQGGGF